MDWSDIIKHKMLECTSWNVFQIMYIMYTYVCRISEEKKKGEIFLNNTRRKKSSTYFFYSRSFVDYFH